ncbi:MAG: chromosomal replication initiator protein DnaA [bacterium]|nr:chromosomal replication initiator protein DnaA [bacterium]
MTKQDFSGLWQAVLGELEVSLSKANYKTWFKNTNLLEVCGDTAIISVPNIFTKEWIEKKYHSQIFEALARLIDNLIKIEYRVGSIKPGSVDAVRPRVVDKTEAEEDSESAKEGLADSLSEQYISSTPLTKRYNFDNFVVGSSNHLAFAAAKLVAEKPGDHYNPLFLYGPVGVGKTHLMWAINEQVKRVWPKAKAVYIPCEDFTNEFIRAIREGTTKQFTNKYRGVDVLLVDDLQFLAGKDKTQEEFFHTFNTLHQAGKQIVLCSDRPPKDIPTLEERLRSRFEWGMVADISAPDYETRIAILINKAQGKGLDLPGEVVNFIAERFDSNIRELEGSLTRIIAHCEIHDVSPTADLAEAILGIKKIEEEKIDAKKVIGKVASYYNLKIDDIIGAKRDKQIVLPRQIAMYLMRSELDMSFPQIADSLGGRDHTTVMHGVKKIDNLKEKSQAVNLEIKTLKQKIFSYNRPLG